MFAARSLFSFSVVSLTAIGLSGCAGMGGMTYGTGESQEAALIEDVTGALGGGILGGKKERVVIDYSARPGLVLPPETASLPAPGNTAAEAKELANNWPQDPDQLRRYYHELLKKSESDEERKAIIASIQKLPKAQRDLILDDNSQAVAFANQIEEPDFSKGPVDPYTLRRYEEQVKKRKALILAANGQTGDLNKRKYLTQPPEAYRSLTPEVQAELAKAKLPEETEEKKTGLSRLWPF